MSGDLKSVTLLSGWKSHTFSYETALFHYQPVHPPNSFLSVVCKVVLPTGRKLFRTPAIRIHFTGEIRNWNWDFLHRKPVLYWMPFQTAVLKTIFWGQEEAEFYASLPKMCESGERERKGGTHNDPSMLCNSHLHTIRIMLWSTDRLAWGFVCRFQAVLQFRSPLSPEPSLSVPCNYVVKWMPGWGGGGTKIYIFLSSHSRYRLQTNSLSNSIIFQWPLITSTTLFCWTRWLQINKERVKKEGWGKVEIRAKKNISSMVVNTDPAAGRMIQSCFIPSWAHFAQYGLLLAMTALQDFGQRSFLLSIQNLRSFRARYAPSRDGASPAPHCLPPNRVVAR